MYAAVLRSCPDHAVPRAVPTLAAIFSVKEGTAQAVVDSAPIILVDDLQLPEAATLQVILKALIDLGADIVFDDNPAPELPKIDWPSKPRIYKQTFDTHIQALNIDLPLPDGGRATALELLIARLTGAAPSGAYAPTSSARPATSAMEQPSSGRYEFQGSDLGEITPFSSIALPATESGTRAASTTQPGQTDVGTRMDQLFGGESGEAGLIPNSDDIASIMDQLMPSDEPAAMVHTPTPPSRAMAPPPSGSYRINGGAAPSGSGGFSVFLAKIADPARRERAAPLLAELARISEDEATDLTSKVVIPVLRSVSREEAEVAKRRFAEIGVLARIKQG